MDDMIMSERALHRSLGSARALRAGDGAPAIANFLFYSIEPGEDCFGEGAKTSTRGACAPQISAERTRK